MKKIVTITALSLLLGTAAYPQVQHEFSLHGGGGISTLTYKPTEGSLSNGLGGHFGLGYGFFFNPQWSLLTGAEFAMYNSNFKLNSLTTESLARDNHHGLDFTFRSTIADYEEKHGGNFIQIPLMLRYHTGMFYAGAGAKVGIPLSGKSKGSYGTIKNEGIYPNEPPPYDTDDLWFRGFGTFPNSSYPKKDYDGDLDFDLAFLLSLEVGAKFELSEKWSLYAGAYFDYGLNNIYKEPDVAQSFVAYNNPSGPDSRNATFDVNSVLNSRYTNSSATAATFTDKMAPMAVGLKVRLAFGIPKKEKIADEPSTYVDPPPPVKEEVADVVDVPDTTDPDADRRAAEEAEAARKAAEEAEAARRAAEEAEAARRAAEEAEAKEAADARKRAEEIIQEPTDSYNISITSLDPEQRRILDEKVALLKQYPDIQIDIYGHTCDIGSREVNQRVGMQRAQRAKAYLVSNGIDESRISLVTTKLYDEPVVPNTSEENRKQNRRVQLLIVD